jgi:hypothetical protein
VKESNENQKYKQHTWEKSAPAVVIPLPDIQAAYKTDHVLIVSLSCSMATATFERVPVEGNTGATHLFSGYDQSTRHRRVWSGLNLPERRHTLPMAILLASSTITITIRQTYTTILAGM